MFAYDIGMDALWIELQLLGQQIAEASSIEDRPRADDGCAGKARKLPGHIGHDVNGVGHNQKNRFSTMLREVRNKALKYLEVALKTVQAAFTRIALASCCNDDNISLCAIRQSSNSYHDRFNERQSLDQIHHFPFHLLRIGIN